MRCSVVPLAFAVCAACALARADDKLLLMHYMPWYETPEVRGHWGKHWTGPKKQHDPARLNAWLLGEVAVAVDQTLKALDGAKLSDADFDQRLIDLSRQAAADIQAKVIDPRFAAPEARVVLPSLTGEQVPQGAGGTVAVYTRSGKPVHIISKVVMRMQAWLAYLTSP